MAQMWIDGGRGIALEAIARSRPRTVDEIMQSGGLLRWQAELVQASMNGA